MAYIATIIGALISAPASAAAATALNVPFTPQAPNNEWRTEPFADACEEASIVMIDAFYHNHALTPSRVRANILGLVSYEMKTFGFHKDTSAELTARLINEDSGFWAHVVENPTIDDMRHQIDQGYPVIVPIYAPLVKNPHYRSPGNPYHVVVVIGYDDTRHEFITHDPGTRYGKQYRYPMDRLMNANHDYTKPNNGTGARVMIFTEP